MRLAKCVMIGTQYESVQWEEGPGKILRGLRIG
jgi:hypothetical protein